MENKKNLPYIPLYTGDWEKDCNVLSLEAEAAWLRIIFKMFNNGKQSSYKISTKALQNLWRVPEDRMYNIIQEFKNENICDVHEDGRFLIFKKNNLENRKTFLYIMILESMYEEFVKIGISSSIENLHGRYKYYGITIKETLSIIPYPNRSLARENEKKLHELFRNYRFTPKFEFGGKTECFEISITNKIQTHGT